MRLSLRHEYHDNHHNALYTPSGIARSSQIVKATAAAHRAPRGGSLLLLRWCCRSLLLLLLLLQLVLLVAVLCPVLLFGFLLKLFSDVYILHHPISNTHYFFVFTVVKPLFLPDRHCQLFSPAVMAATALPAPAAVGSPGFPWLRHDVFLVYTSLLYVPRVTCDHAHLANVAVNLDY